MIGNVLQKAQVLTALLKNILNALNVLKKEWINGIQKQTIHVDVIVVKRIIMKEIIQPNGIASVENYDFIFGDEKLYTDSNFLDWEFYIDKKNNIIYLNSTKFQRKPKSLLEAIKGYLNIN